MFPQAYEKGRDSVRGRQDSCDDECSIRDSNC
jgi:hypothetical protein